MDKCFRVSGKAMPRVQRASRGFSLLEVCTALVVVGVVASLALPHLASSIRQCRRGDALQAFTALQLAQEQWRDDHPTYASPSALSMPWPHGLGLSAISAGGYYQLSVTAEPQADSLGYTLRATAVPGRGQELDAAGDTSCAVLSLTVREGVATPSPRACWPR